MSALGVHIGCYVHIAAAAIGLASIINHSPIVYDVMKFIGAVYLVWLGLRMFPGSHHGSKDAHNLRPNSFRDSIVVEILNPKTALFFVTFLPQFVDPASTMPLWAQFLLLGLFVNCVFSIADIASVGIASFTLVRLKGLGGASMLPKGCGMILIGLGLALAIHHA